MRARLHAHLYPARSVLNAPPRPEAATQEAASAAEFEAGSVAPNAAPADSVVVGGPVVAQPGVQPAVQLAASDASAVTTTALVAAEPSSAIATSGAAEGVEPNPRAPPAAPEAPAAAEEFGSIRPGASDVARPDCSGPLPPPEVWQRRVCRRLTRVRSDIRERAEAASSVGSVDTEQADGGDGRPAQPARSR
eukprot:8073893-Alexandrium_andersonii.AAC.1